MFPEMFPIASGLTEFHLVLGGVAGLAAAGGLALARSYRARGASISSLTTPGAPRDVEKAQRPGSRKRKSGEEHYHVCCPLYPLLERRLTSE